MNRTKLMTGLLASAIVLAAGIGVGTANAARAPQIDTGGASLVLPMMGTPLTLTVTTGPGGTIADAQLEDPAGFVATELDANKVKMVNTDGSFQLSVKSKNNEQRISAKADTLEKLVGENVWNGGIFGTVPTTVRFTVTGDGGVPGIDQASIAVTPGDGEAFEIGTVKTETEDDEMQAKVSILFTKDGQSRSLSIKVEVHTASAEDDDDSPEGASMRITLSRVRGVAVPASEAAGEKTWSAMLCDGQTATVTYNVGEDGSVTLVGEPVPAGEVRTDDGDDDGGRIEVRWPTGERVRISAELEDGEITVNVKERIRCRDAADPTTNVSTSTTVDDDEGHDDDEEEHEDDDDDHDKGRHGGDDDDDHDDDHGGEDD